MEFEQVVKKRRSVRRFQERKVPGSIVKKILKLSNLAPSAGNLQARKVVLVKDKKVKEKIAQVCLDQNFISKASLVFVVCADLEQSASKYGKRGKELYALQDATLFASYLQLAAVEFGLDSCWVGAFDEQRLKEILKLQEGLRPIAVLPAGYRVEKSYPSSRKNLNQIVIHFP